MQIKLLRKFSSHLLSKHFRKLLNRREFSQFDTVNMKSLQLKIVVNGASMNVFTLSSGNRQNCSHHFDTGSFGFALLKRTVPLKIKGFMGTMS